jgi:hypothetical protein
VIRGASRISDVVRALVRAFAVFVPRGGVFDSEADAAPAIVLWRGATAAPLRLGDLATLRLVGVASEHALPSTIENHVSVYDVDEQTLKAPAYEGAVVPSSGAGNSSSGGGNSAHYRQSPRRSVPPPARVAAAAPRVGGVGAAHGGGAVDDILSLHRSWPDEATYLAFVHHMLYELAAKACLYYHLCAVEPAAMGRRSSSHTSLFGVESEEDDADHEPLSGTVTPVQRPPVRSSLARLSMQLLSGSSSFSAATTHDAASSAGGQSGGGGAASEDGALAALGQLPFSRSSARETFFRRMGIADCDIDIIVNLAELVKLQQDTERRPANAAPTLRLDYSTCAVFRNTTSVAQGAASKGRSPQSSMNRF